MMHLRSLRGFTLVEVLVATSVTAIAVAAAVSILVSLSKEKRRNEILLNLSAIRLEFQEHLLRNRDWQATKGANPAMSCFNGSTATSCASLIASGKQPLKLVSGDSSLIYDSANPQSGYTLQGAACDTYGSSKDCVIKPLLTWEVQCNTAFDPSCVSPLVNTDLGFIYSGPDIGSINFKIYGFHLSNSTFPFPSTGACTGAVPVCTATQAAICEAGAWTCEEFGL